MAFVYEACRTSPLPFQCPHDPDGEKYYSFRYRAPAWSATTEKREKSGNEDSGDIVRPSVANGFYFECTSGGITAATEPTTWVTKTGAKTVDGDVEWVAIPDRLMLKQGDTLTASAWVSDDVGVVLANDSLSGFDTFVQVTAVASGATSFILRNEITVTRSDGKIEKFNRSLKIKVKEQ